LVGCLCWQLGFGYGQVGDFKNFKTLWCCNRTRCVLPCYLISSSYLCCFFIFHVLIVKAGCCQSPEVLGFSWRFRGLDQNLEAPDLCPKVPGSGHNQSPAWFCYDICITFTCYTFLCTPRWVEYTAVTTHAHNVCLYILKGFFVTTPPEIIPYYRLNHSIWSLSDNKEASRWVLPQLVSERPNAPEWLD
jgi:hypothetical protein